MGKGVRKIASQGLEMTCVFFQHTLRLSLAYLPTTSAGKKQISFPNHRIEPDLFLQASCKKKLHLPLLKSAFFKRGLEGGGEGGGAGVVLKWN